MSRYSWFDLTPREREALAELVPASVPPQIAAKSTDATPVGGPGLYASASDIPTDGGWWNVDITADAVDLSVGTDAGDSSITFALIDPIGGGVHGDGPARGEMSISADDGNTNVNAGIIVTTDPDSSGPSSELRLQGAGAGTVGGIIFFKCGPDGAQGRIDVVPGQAAVPLVIEDVYGGQIFQVDTQGAILFSPNGSGHRLLVANDGTLSTEAV